MPKRILKRILHGPRDDVDIFMEKFSKKFHRSSLSTDELLSRYVDDNKINAMEETPVGEDPDDYELF